MVEGHYDLLREYVVEFVICTEAVDMQMISIDVFKFEKMNFSLSSDGRIFGVNIFQFRTEFGL